MITFHFKADVLFESVVITKMIDSDGVVDNEINGGKRIHFSGIATEAFNRLTHGGKVDHRRDAGKVLHQNAGGTVSNFTVGMGCFQPSRKGTDIFFCDRIVILPAQEIFE